MDDMQSFTCSGEQWHAAGGSWIGHLLPGIFMCFWGLWWALSIHAGYLSTGKHRAAASYTIRIGSLPVPLEAWFKLLIPPIAMIMEWTDSGTKQLVCPPGSVRAGHVDVEHINTFSHLTNYPPIMVSGVIDLLALHWPHLVPLPSALPHTTLSFSFGLGAFIMLSHTKHVALDALVHQYLGYTMAAVSALVMAEGVWSNSVVLGWMKAAALILEGAWFFAITHIEFSSDPFWDGTMGPLMFAPVLMAWIIFGVMLLMLGSYIAMAVYYSAQGSCSLSWGHQPHAEVTPPGGKGGSSNQSRPLPGKYLALVPTSMDLRAAEAEAAVDHHYQRDVEVI